MLGIGTIINTASIIVGGLIGLVIKQRFSENLQKSLMKALGLSTMFVGISGALIGLLSIDNVDLKTKGSMLMIFSLVIGTFIGEMLNIEDNLDKLGNKLKKLLKAEGDNKFTEGFVTSTLVVCVGAMAVVGSLQEGLSGDSSMLLTKSILDGVILIIFASTLGVGSLFSAIPLFIYQGSITLMAKIISPYLSDMLIANLSSVGSILIFAIGINLAFGKKFKAGNMLPALLIPIIYTIFLQLIIK